MQEKIIYPLFERFISDKRVKDAEGSDNDEVGHGAFGKVYKVTIGEDEDKKNDSSKRIIQYDPKKVCAIKKLNEQQFKYIIREACLLNSLNHPFVIKLTACYFFEKLTFCPSFIMPYAENGSLFNNIPRVDFREKWSALEKNKFLYGMCRSVWFLHHLNIFHRDIKSENILVTEDKIPLLSDLGFSKYKKFDSQNSAVVRSAYYAPPEAHSLQSSFPSDVFSLAITLWEFFERKKIKKYVDTVLNKYKITNFAVFYKKEDRRPPFTDRTPICWQELIKRMWQTDSLKRPKMNEVIDEIKKREYFLPGVDADEMISFIEKVQKEEDDAYFYQSSDTIKFIKGNNQEDYFAQLFFKNPINKLIEQFNQDAEIERDVINEGEVQTNDLDNNLSGSTRINPYDNNDEFPIDLSEIDHYKIYFNLYLKLIHGVNGLAAVKDADAMLSIALFCIMKLHDYSAAYKILKELEEVDKNKSRAFLQFINKESEKSLFIKGMILEGQEKYQEATEIYNDSLDKEGFDIRVYGRLGRLYAIYGTNDELRDEGLQMMDHSSFLGDDFSSFQLGLIYLKRVEKSSSSPSNTENLEKSRYYFELADQFPDSIYQIYKTYLIEGANDDILKEIKLKIDQIYGNEDTEEGNYAAFN